MTIYQGSTYKLPFKLTFNGQSVTDKDAKAVEFSAGELRKIGVYENGYFVFNLTQEDTFKLEPKDREYQIRVCFADNTVKPTAKQPLTVCETISKEVLQ